MNERPIGAFREHVQPLPAQNSYMPSGKIFPISRHLSSMQASPREIVRTKSARDKNTHKHENRCHTKTNTQTTQTQKIWILQNAIYTRQRTYADTKQKTLSWRFPPFIISKGAEAVRESTHTKKYKPTKARDTWK